MTAIGPRPATDCRFDLVALSEVMLRLDPGERRIHTTRSFDAWAGGGEYNVARGLRRCFGLRTAIVTALVDSARSRSSALRASGLSVFEIILTVPGALGVIEELVTRLGDRASPAR